jgi:kynurenine formamidase
MSRIIELSNKATVFAGPGSLESGIRIPGMTLQSVGPIRHAVNVPFHDSQARGKAILIQTGWDERTDAGSEPGPYLHEDLVFRFIRSNVRLVGVDFPLNDESVRLQLLERQIAVVENLCSLKFAPRWGFNFCVEGSPVRAFAEIPV